MKRCENIDGEEEESRCWICLDEESYEGNLIVFCDGCELAVHQKCYALASIPSGDFYCRACEARREKTSKSRASKNRFDKDARKCKNVSIYFLELLSFVRAAGGNDYGFPKLATEARVMYEAFRVNRENDDASDEGRLGQNWKSKMALLRDLHVTILRGIDAVRFEKHAWIRALRKTLIKCSSSEGNLNLATQLFKDRMPLCDWNKAMRAFLGFPLVVRLRPEDDENQRENAYVLEDHEDAEARDDDEWVERTYFALSARQRAWLSLLACTYLCERSDFLRQRFNAQRRDACNDSRTSFRMSVVGTDARGRTVRFMDAGGGHFWILRASDVVSDGEGDTTATIDDDLRGRRIEKVFNVDGDDVIFGGFVIDFYPANQADDDEVLYEVLYDDGDVERFSRDELSGCFVEEDDDLTSSSAFDINPIVGNGRNTTSLSIVCDSLASTRAYAASLESSANVSELRLWHFLRKRAIPKYERAEELKLALLAKQKRLRKALGLSASHFAMIQHEILASHMSAYVEEEEAQGNNDDNPGRFGNETRSALVDLNRGQKRNASRKRALGKKARKRGDPPRRRIRRSSRARAEVDYSNAEYDEKMSRAIGGFGGS